METTERYYKQQSAKPEVLEVCHHPGGTWLRVAQVGKGVETQEWAV